MKCLYLLNCLVIAKNGYKESRLINQFHMNSLLPQRQ